MTAAKPDEAWFDYDFTILARRAREEIVAIITLPPSVCQKRPFYLCCIVLGRYSLILDSLRQSLAFVLVNLCLSIYIFFLLRMPVCTSRAFPLSVFDIRQDPLCVFFIS